MNTKSNIFFCIGAQKAGTTWLYNCLSQHPETYMPPIKELHFFDEIERTNLDWKSRLFGTKGLDKKWKLAIGYGLLKILTFDRVKDHWWLIKFMLIGRKKKNIPLFINHLDSLNNDEKLLKGDITPAYSILSKKTIQEIYKNIPHSKIILLLRNPIEREWSHAKMDLLKFKNKGMSEFDEKEFEEFFCKKNDRSNYIRTLSNWMAYYPPEQILICFYDELQMTPKHLFDKICQFLEIELMEEAPFIKKTYLKGVKGNIPFKFQYLLAKKHHKQMVSLAERFEGKISVNYPKSWLKDCEEILNSVI